MSGVNFGKVKEFDDKEGFEKEIKRLEEINKGKSHVEIRKKVFGHDSRRVYENKGELKNENR